MRWMMCAIAGLAAAGPVLGQSAASGAARDGERATAPQTVFTRAGSAGSDGTVLLHPAAAGSGGIFPSAVQFAWTAQAPQPASGARPGPDASMFMLREFVQQQQREARTLKIDGKPVTLRSTGASLQVYLADEPYPESRMKSADDGAVLLDSDGKPAGRMVVHDNRVELRPVEDAQSTGRLLIGVSLSPLDSTLAQHLKVEPEKAMLISGVTPGWPASKAGLAAGDIIIAVEERDEGTSEAIREVIAERQAGDSLRVKVIRGGEKKDVKIILSDEARAAASGVGFGATNYAPMQLSQMHQQASQYLAAMPSMAEARVERSPADEARQQATRARRVRPGIGRSEGSGSGVGAGRSGPSDYALAGTPPSGSSYALTTDGSARVTVDIPAGGGRAVVRSHGEGDISRRLATLEEQMNRIEKMLQKLTEQSGGR